MVSDITVVSEISLGVISSDVLLAVFSSAFSLISGEIFTGCIPFSLK